MNRSDNQVTSSKRKHSKLGKRWPTYIIPAHGKVPKVIVRSSKLRA